MRAESSCLMAGMLRERAADETEIARTRAAGGHAGQQTLDVVDPLEFVAQARAHAALLDEFFHRIQAGFDGLALCEWRGDPLGQQSRAHGRGRAIEHGQQ